MLSWLYLCARHCFDLEALRRRNDHDLNRRWDNYDDFYELYVASLIDDNHLADDNHHKSPDPATL